MPTPPRSVTLVPRALLSTVATAALLATACSSLTSEELADRYRGPDPANVGVDQGLTPPDVDGKTMAADDVESSPNSKGSAHGRLPRREPLTPKITDCSFDPGLYTVECGSIQIPSETPGVDPVRISFARFKTSASGGRDDPVLYLHGGPGGSVLDAAVLFAPSIIDPFIDTRDVVLYDQRGGGESSSLPTCTEAWALDDRYFSSDEHHADISAAYLEILDGCAERFERRSTIALDEYNSATNADDLLDLIRALGFDTVNLYGNSYGTRLAQTMLRDHPEQIRSVILSGVYPIEENLIGSVPDAFRSALDKVFQACVGHPQCREHLPDPWATLDAIVTQIDADPIEVAVPGGAGTDFPLHVGGDDLIALLHGLLYTAGGAALIPDLLIDIENGHTNRLMRVGSDAIYDTASVLGYLAVQCREEVPFTTDEQAAEANRTDTLWHRVSLPPAVIGNLALDACPLFGTIGEADPLENEPVTWSQPTLILSGGFDPVTPPWWAEQVAARLPDATLVSFADRGHDADEGFCASDLLARFVDDPHAPVTIDCTTDDDGPHLNMRPEITHSPVEASLRATTFDIDTENSGRNVPMQLPDWPVERYVDEEAYWRDLDGWDQTTVVVRAGLWDESEVLFYVDSLSRSGFRVTEPVGEVSDRWTRRAYDTNSLDAVSYIIEEDGFSMNVSLVALGGEIDALELVVLLPIIESIELP